MWNWFYASFRMDTNAKSIPLLTRTLKKTVTHPKTKQAVQFFANISRLELYFIIWHYVNLYVFCVRFITFFKYWLGPNPISRVCFNNWRITNLKVYGTKKCNLFHIKISNVAKITYGFYGDSTISDSLDEHDNTGNMSYIKSAFDRKKYS